MRSIIMCAVVAISMAAPIRAAKQFSPRVRLGDPPQTFLSSLCHAIAVSDRLDTVCGAKWREGLDCVSKGRILSKWGRIM